MNEYPSEFPKVGGKITFKGVPKFYYPMFTHIGDYARLNLIINEEYTVIKVEIFSSWNAVYIDGHEQAFNLSFFK